MLAPYALLLVLVFFSSEQVHAQSDCPNYIATPTKVYCLASYKGPPIELPMPSITEDVILSDEGVVYEKDEIIPVEVQYHDGEVTIDDTTHP